MSGAARRRIGISKKRGFRLRCFLEFRHPIGLLMFFALVAEFAWICRAQCVYPRTSVLHAQGAVFDKSGVPISGADVTLKKGDKVVSGAKTGRMGGFLIATSPGTYDLDVSARNFAPGFARIDVGSDLVRVLKPTHLWMILDVGATTDACTFISTSRRQLEKAIQENKR
ncbi:MAG TPA: carboxypeptidase-like regulatory domain-containing protein [Terracidiphilus sp.]|nr:carboxypeptidase-like regulatory domain-containing protein [Terracidiphilus sp.]